MPDYFDLGYDDGLFDEPPNPPPHRGPDADAYWHGYRVGRAAAVPEHERVGTWIDA